MKQRLRNNGCRLVSGTRRVTRDGGTTDSLFFFARMFYKLINHISQVEMVTGARDSLDAPSHGRCYHGVIGVQPFLKRNFAWVDLRQNTSNIKNVERVAGETSWNFWSLFKYSIEGLSISDAPLNIAFTGGLLSWILAFIMMILIVTAPWSLGSYFPGWPSLMTVILFPWEGSSLLTIGF